MLDPPTLEAHGVRILIHPITLLLESIRAQRAALEALRAGRPATTETIATARDVLDAAAAEALQRR